MIDSLIQIFVLLGTALWQIVATVPLNQPTSAAVPTPAVTAAPQPSTSPQPTLTPIPAATDGQADDCDFDYHYDSDEDPAFDGRVSVNFKCRQENQNNSTSSVKTNADINTGSSAGDVKVDISVKNKIGS